jgi:Right handed beta helix region
VSEKVYQAKQPITRFAPGGTADRMAATATGTTVAMQQASLGMLAPGAIAGRAATKIVAASNASAQMLAAADYVCDGVADEVQINAALTALGSVGGRVLLSEGTFTLAAPIVFVGVRRVLQGMGMGATILAIVNAGGAPINTNIVNLNAHYCEVSDLTVDGNKANNASATGMVLVNMTSDSPLVQRVRMLNSAMYGIVSQASVQNGVVRDCLIENSSYHQAIFRAASGQPLLVSGCTFKGGGSQGATCDNGPVIVSDCQALSNASYGFNVYGTGLATFINCLAQNSGNFGFVAEGSAQRTRWIGCQAIGNAGCGFAPDGSNLQLIGCFATGSTGDGRGFRGIGIDVLYSGCVAIDNLGPGFYTAAAASRTRYVGCSSINNALGFQVTDGVAHIEGCYIYGKSSGGAGVYLIGSSSNNHIVNGCRIMNNGGDGIWVGDTVSSVQITNNSISDSSLSTNGVAKHITVVGDRVHIEGNMLRDPAAGNRPLHGIRVDGPSDNSYLGLNDAYGTGISGANPEISDSGLNTLRVIKLQLDYTASTDLIAGTSLTNGVWADIGTNQTFRVDSPHSTVEISCWGMMQFGGQGICEISSRLVIDSGGTPIYKKLGAEVVETNTGYQNPLTGAHPVNLTGLAVGNHTVKLQVICLNTASYAWLRAGSFAWEFLNIQVTEFLQ